MKISSAFPSRYLKAADLPEGLDVPVKIDEVRMELMEQTKEEKPVLYFIGKERGLVLNVTNANTIAEGYGDDTETWHGLPISLFATTTEFSGRMVPCVRVRVPRPTAPAPQQPVAATTSQDELAAVNHQLNAEGDADLSDIPF